MGYLLSPVERRKKIVDFFKNNLSVAEEKVGKDVLALIDQFEAGEIKLEDLSFEQRTAVQKAYALHINFRFDDRFVSSQIHYETADYCSFCDSASFDLPKISDKKGTIVLCHTCRKILTVHDIWGLVDDENYECMLTKTKGAVKLEDYDSLPEPLIIKSDILIRMYNYRLSPSEHQQIEDIYGGDERIKIFFHVI